MSDDPHPGSWWTTLPGILSGLAGIITALGTLILGLNQAGVLGGNRGTTTAQPPVATQNPVAPAPTPVAMTGQAAPGADDAALLQSLKAAGIGNSVGDATLLDWLDDADRHYRRLAEACLRIVGQRRFTGAGVDIDKVNHYYNASIGLTDDELMPAAQQVDALKLTQALLNAHNNKNGGRATTLAQVLKPAP